ncbi:hypothetical protein RHMOL_Rhmol11G0098000 [Rhododendron molle]|uniref:Uncharacterized protein n=1 Tax=Rhododendron molle TaxID=49168 RepID=A0ACC0LQ54_RHOML|nr:hypothetical protein RHMOL_Rhmol11G0098000 [Rhododendron molle]
MAFAPGEFKPLSEFFLKESIIPILPFGMHLAQGLHHGRGVIFRLANRSLNEDGGGVLAMVT